MLFIDHKKAAVQNFVTFNEGLTVMMLKIFNPRLHIIVNCKKSIYQLIMGKKLKNLNFALDTVF